MPRTRAQPYYGWYIAITLAITETISWGIIYYVFSVFLAPMESELGWSRSELTGGFSLAFLVKGLMAYPVGAWIDQHGARRLMTAGSLGASVLVIAWSQVQTLPAFYAIWLLLGVCAAAVLYDSAFAVIAQWFQRRRSTALAIVTFAAGLASTIFLPLADALLQAYGWRAAVLILGVLMAGVTVPLHALVLRRRPADLGLLPDGAPILADAPALEPHSVGFRAAISGRVFIWMTLGFSLSTMAAGAIRVHFIPFLIDAGIDASSAAYAAAVIGAMQVVGRVFFAPLDQRFSTHTIMVGLFVLQAGALALLLFGSSTLIIGAFIVLFGAAHGAMTLVLPSMLAELYGVTHYGRISSINAIFFTLAGTAAPLLASLLYEGFGGYQSVVVLVVALALVSVVAIGMTRRLILLPRPDFAQ